MREIDNKVELGVVQSQVLHKENFIAIIILSNSTYLVNKRHLQRIHKIVKLIQQKYNYYHYLLVIREPNLLYPTKMLSL
jgi:hypothetical protein